MMAQLHALRDQVDAAIEGMGMGDADKQQVRLLLKEQLTECGTNARVQVVVLKQWLESLVPDVARKTPPPMVSYNWRRE